ncbi:MAG: hypothetical protein WBB28_01310 [Crinalium sp.]
MNCNKNDISIAITLSSLKSLEFLIQLGTFVDAQGRLRYSKGTVIDGKGVGGLYADDKRDGSTVADKNKSSSSKDDADLDSFDKEMDELAKEASQYIDKAGEYMEIPDEWYQELDEESQALLAGQAASPVTEAYQREVAELVRAENPELADAILADIPNNKITTPEKAVTDLTTAIAENAQTVVDKEKPETKKIAATAKAMNAATSLGIILSQGFNGTTEQVTKIANSIGSLANERISTVPLPKLPAIKNIPVAEAAQGIVGAIAGLNIGKELSQHLVDPIEQFVIDQLVKVLAATDPAKHTHTFEEEWDESLKTHDQMQEFIVKRMSYEFSFLNDNNRKKRKETPEVFDTFQRTVRTSEKTLNAWGYEIEEEDFIDNVGKGTDGFQMFPVYRASENTVYVNFPGSSGDKGDNESFFAEKAEARGETGRTQFDNNKKQIKAYLEKQQTQGRKVRLQGQCLGSSLIQIIASEYPDLVDEVAAYNTVGVNAATAKKFKEYKQLQDKKPKEERHEIKVTHSIKEGDFISLLGDVYLPGEIVYWKNPPGVWDWQPHKSMTTEFAVKSNDIPPWVKAKIYTNQKDLGDKKTINTQIKEIAKILVKKPDDA